MEEEFIRNQEQMKPLEEKQEVSTFIIVSILYDIKYKLSFYYYNYYYIIIIVFILNQKNHNLAWIGIIEYKYWMKDSQI